jgi:hypothetical protein
MPSSHGLAAAVLAAGLASAAPAAAATFLDPGATVTLSELPASYTIGQSFPERFILFDDAYSFVVNDAFLAGQGGQFTLEVTLAGDGVLPQFYDIVSGPGVLVTDEVWVIPRTFTALISQPGTYVVRAQGVTASATGSAYSGLIAITPIPAGLALLGTALGALAMGAQARGPLTSARPHGNC